MYVHVCVSVCVCVFVLIYTYIHIYTVHTQTFILDAINRDYSILALI